MSHRRREYSSEEEEEHSPPPAKATMSLNDRFSSVEAKNKKVKAERDSVKKVDFAGKQFCTTVLPSGNTTTTFLHY